MLGYGKSDKYIEAGFTWTGQADRLVKFMDALGIKKANIVGHDQGGGVTLIFCSRYPEKVSRYISANGCTYDYPESRANNEIISKTNPFIKTICVGQGFSLAND